MEQFVSSLTTLNILDLKAAVSEKAGNNKIQVLGPVKVILKEVVGYMNTAFSTPAEQIQFTFETLDGNVLIHTEGAKNKDGDVNPKLKRIMGMLAYTLPMGEVAFAQKIASMTPKLDFKNEFGVEFTQASAATFDDNQKSLILIQQEISSYIDRKGETRLKRDYTLTDSVMWRVSDGASSTEIKIFEAKKLLGDASATEQAKSNFGVNLTYWNATESKAKLTKIKWNKEKTFLKDPALNTILKYLTDKPDATFKELNEKFTTLKGGNATKPASTGTPESDMINSITDLGSMI